MSTAEPKSSAPSGASMPIIATGCAALILSIVAASTLIYAHLSGAAVPGCGEGAGCDALQKGAWGSIPGLGWPTSHVGAAWFAGLLIAWLMAKGRFADPMQWLVRLGFVGSIVFAIVMVSSGTFCLYCLLTHLGNFGFLVVSELSRRQISAAAAPVPITNALAASLVGMVLVTGGLLVVETSVQTQIAEKEESQLQDSTAEMQAKAREALNNARSDSDANDVNDAAPTSADSEIDVVPAANQASASDTGRAPFIGRYRQGPEKAAIRIVMFSDFQCPDCYRIEEQVREILAERDDVYVSMKHFPFCTDCNPVVTRTLHPNACWAARAAELVGQLKGNDAFWVFHDWLFDKGGVFKTTDELSEGAALVGLSGRDLAVAMNANKDSLDALIKADVEEAMALGLNFTPMVFVNGVELEGFRRDGALLRAVEAVASVNPPAEGPEADQPPLAREKYVKDWQNGFVRQLPDQTAWPMYGAADAPVKIQFWGDLRSPYTKRAWSALRSAISGRTDCVVIWRHFPTAQECNEEFTQATRHDDSCLASKAFEAAGIVGGPALVQSFFERIVAFNGVMTMRNVQDWALEFGVDPDAVTMAMENATVPAAIREDVMMTKRIPTMGYPMFIINERYVPRWQLNEESLLPEYIRRAAEEQRSIGNE